MNKAARVTNKQKKTKNAYMLCIFVCLLVMLVLQGIGFFESKNEKWISFHNRMVASFSENTNQNILFHELPDQLQSLYDQALQAGKVNHSEAEPIIAEALTVLKESQDLLKQEHTILEETIRNNEKAEDMLKAITKNPFKLKEHFDVYDGFLLTYKQALEQYAMVLDSEQQLYDLLDDEVELTAIDDELRERNKKTEEVTASLQKANQYIEAYNGLTY